MELTVPRVAISILAALVLVSSAEAGNKNYLAFPRMGRSNNYLAFPRMGRSQPMGGSCCEMGVTAEFMIGSNGGKVGLSDFCPNSETCCDGLEETIVTTPNDVMYSVCLPVRPINEKGRHSSRGFEALKTLIRRK